MNTTHTTNHEAIALFKAIGTSKAARLCGDAQDFREGKEAKRDEAMRMLRALAAK